MSRMTIPTMDVVRFKEDDVIVASGGPGPQPTPPITTIFELTGFNDSQSNNAYVGHIPVNEFSALYSASGAESHLLFADRDGVGVKAEDLVDHDVTGTIDNGTYAYSDGMWRYRNQ